MSASLSPATRARQSNSVAQQLRDIRPRPAKVALPCAAPATEGKSESIQQKNPVLALIEAAMIRADLKQGAMAANAEIDEPRMSRALKEKDNRVFDVRWFGPQPLVFWEALHKEIGDRYGFTDRTSAEVMLEQTKGIVAAVYGLLQELTKNTTVSE